MNSIQAAKAQAISNANAELNNAYLPTYDELLAALQGVQNAWNENRLLTSDEAFAVRSVVSQAA